MKTETNHTPTPWHVNGQDIFSEHDTITRMVYSAIPEDEQEANADHIVRCVNSHDELLACLNRIRGEVKLPPDIYRWVDNLLFAQEKDTQHTAESGEVNP